MYIVHIYNAKTNISEGYGKSLAAVLQCCQVREIEKKLIKTKGAQDAQRKLLRRSA